MAHQPYRIDCKRGALPANLIVLRYYQSFVLCQAANGTAGRPHRQGCYEL